MSWTEKDKPTPFDEAHIEGLYYLDGDMLAQLFNRDWTKGQKYPLIAFPSGMECDVWPTSRPEALAIIHLFGEMDLPLGDTLDSAFEQANDIAEQCGYFVVRVGDDRMEVWGHDIDEHMVIVYDNEKHQMSDVIQIKDEPERPRAKHECLLDEETKALLPPLYSGEEQGIEAKALVKFFSPDSNWTWYASEFDGKDTFFGLVSGFEIELGYFALSELEAARGPMGLAIERDRHFESKTLNELREMHRKER